MTSTRARIVTATTELFRRQGFHGTSLKDVAAGSGAPTGSIYHFFPGGKTELAEASLLESGAAYQQLFELTGAGVRSGANRRGAGTLRALAAIGAASAPSAPLHPC